MKLCVANWKMKLTTAAGLKLLNELEEFTSSLSKSELWIAAPATSLAALSLYARGQSRLLRIGAQNCHPEPEGAFTGEISVPLIREVGGAFTLIGHSECRHQFGESEALVQSRFLGVRKQQLPVILCVGETLEQYRSGSCLEVLRDQLKVLATPLPGTSKLPPTSEATSLGGGLLIAYEPVWAIGTGLTPRLEEIQAVHRSIQGLVPRGIPLLYGGSVTPDNIREILSLSEVDGVLVGGASTKAASLRAIIEACEEAS